MREIKIGNIYKHFKNKYYIVLDIVNDLFIIKTLPETPKISYGIITLKNNVLSNSCNKFINYLIN